MLAQNSEDLINKNGPNVVFPEAFLLNPGARADCTGGLEVSFFATGSGRFSTQEWSVVQGRV